MGGTVIMQGNMTCGAIWCGEFDVWTNIMCGPIWCMPVLCDWFDMAGTYLMCGQYDVWSYLMHCPMWYMVNFLHLNLFDTSHIKYTYLMCGQYDVWSHLMHCPVWYMVNFLHLRCHATINLNQWEFHNTLTFCCEPCKETVDEFSSGVINVFFDILPQM